MGYDSYSNYPQAYTTKPEYNYTKVISTAVDNDEPWPTLSLLSQQLNLFDDQSQDVMLKQYANTARRFIEEYLNRNLTTGVKTSDVYYPASVFTQTFAQPVAYLDLPTEAASNLNIASLSYWNNATPSVKTTIPTTDYFLDPTGELSRIIITKIPTDVSSVIAAPIIVNIGYATSNNIMNDPVVIQAALLLATYFYNNRDAMTELNLKAIPIGITALLASYKDVLL